MKRKVYQFPVIFEQATMASVYLTPPTKIPVNPGEEGNQEDADVKSLHHSLKEDQESGYSGLLW